MNSHSHTDCGCLFTPAKMQSLPTPLLIVSWTCRIAAAVILLQTLYFKFTAAEESVYIFTKVGLEPWGRYATGIASDATNSERIICFMPVRRGRRTNLTKSFWSDR